MAKRRTAASVKIERFIELLKSQIELEKIILFGSWAKGEPNKWSDIDVAVISNHFAKMNFHRRLVLLGLLAWQAKATEIEALGYTVDEYKNATKLDFLGGDQKTGKIIYEK
jgi:predicted nucleotidyltransferase